MSMNNYSLLINNISSLLEQGRKQAVYAINNILVQTYWQIGKQIVEYEQRGKIRAEYGSNLLKQLSNDLTKKYERGFSVDNLENMRRFYLLFPKSEPAARKLSWTHHCLIMRVENPDARGFYLIESEKENWSKRELQRQINSLLYERLCLSKDKNKVKQLALKGQIIEKPVDIIKDPYVLEFLDLEDKNSYHEKDLEKALLDKLQKFILELGKGFSLVARQKRITIDNEHYYIDLVFYNYLLKCFFLVDLKAGKLTHQDIGQMDFYIRYFEEEIKQETDNSTIGLILCSSKSKTMVRYTLLKNSKNIFASKYKLYLPTEKELREGLR